MAAMNTTTPFFARNLLFTPGRFFDKVKPIGWEIAVSLLLIGSASNAILKTQNTATLTYTSMAHTGINTLISTLFNAFLFISYAWLIDAMAQMVGKAKKSKATVSVVFYSLYPAMLVVIVFILLVLLKNEWKIELTYTKQILQVSYAIAKLWYLYILFNGIKSIYNLRSSSAILVLLSASLFAGIALAVLFIIGSLL